MAKETAWTNKISRQIIEDTEDLFSREKLAEVNRDFGQTYPRISEFLEQVFSGAKQVYSNEGLKALLTEKIIDGAKVREVFGKLDYVLLATKAKLIDLLYGIGVLGFKKNEGSPLEFVMTNPQPGNLYGAYEYRIHYAYRQSLNLQP